MNFFNVIIILLFVGITFLSFRLLNLWLDNQIERGLWNTKGLNDGEKVE